MQLDIFADSRDVMLRNDVLDALARRHIADSRQAWQRLADEYPGDDTLPALATLIGTLEEVETAGFTDHGALGAARRTLSEEVGPAAIPAIRPTGLVANGLFRAGGSSPSAPLRLLFAPTTATTMPRRCG
jgi:hypothetical protein